VSGQVVKESIHVAEHERRAPELALALDPRASRGDCDSKSGPKSAQKEASDDDNSPRCRLAVIVTTSPDGTKRFLHCFILLVLLVNDSEYSQSARQ
jgi:hypothetical protein